MMKLRSEPFEGFAHKKVLCVFQPLRLYPGWETLIAGVPMDRLAFDKLPFIKKALLWKSRVMYSRSNPRDFAYLLNLLREFKTRLRHEIVVDLLLPFPLAAPLPEDLQGPVHKLWEFPSGHHERSQMIDEIGKRDFDSVIFLFPDPIGLGWGRTEKLVARLGIPNRYVLNGRKRFFEWNAQSRRKLTWRRFLEHAWVVETMLALLAVIVSIPLVIYDALSKISGAAAKGDSVNNGK